MSNPIDHVMKHAAVTMTYAAWTELLNALYDARQYNVDRDAPYTAERLSDLLQDIRDQIEDRRATAYKLFNEAIDEAKALEEHTS